MQQVVLQLVEEGEKMKLITMARTTTMLMMVVVKREEKEEGLQ